MRLGWHPSVLLNTVLLPLCMLSGGPLPGKPSFLHQMQKPAQENVPLRSQKKYPVMNNIDFLVCFFLFNPKRSLMSAQTTLSPREL